MRKARALAITTLAMLTIMTFARTPISARADETPVVTFPEQGAIEVEICDLDTEPDVPNVWEQLLMAAGLDPTMPKLAGGTHEAYIDRMEFDDWAKKLYEAIEESFDGDGKDDYFLEDKYFDPTSAESKTRALTAKNAAELLAKPGSWGVFADLTGAPKNLFVLSGGIVEMDPTPSAKAWERPCAQIYGLLAAMDRDHPELFWAGRVAKTTVLTLGQDQSGNVTSVIPILYLKHDQDLLKDQDAFDIRFKDWREESKIRAARKTVDDTVSSVIANATAQGAMKASEKVRYFDNWLTANNEYNYKVMDNSKYEDSFCRTAYGALARRAGNDGAVCEGYARAMQLLCDRASIPCELVSGNASSGDSSEAHMWCVVKVEDGKWYLVDPTWDDPTYKVRDTEKAGLISGAETEDWLLTGKDKVASSRTDSNTIYTVRAQDGTDVFTLALTNGPQIADGKFTGLSAKEDISQDRVEASPAAYKAGTPALPTTVTVTHKQSPLSQGIDFQFEGYDNTSQGQGKLQAQGIGKYKGVAKGTFEITEPKDLSEGRVEGPASVTYTGAAQTPALTVYGKGEGPLKEHQDYEVSWAENVHAGTATATVEGRGIWSGNLTHQVKIEAAQISAATVTGIDASYRFQGGAIRPEPTLEFGGAPLAAKTDYTLEYGANKDVSEGGRVTIKGQGDFQGSTEKTFAIEAASVDEATAEVAAGQTYTGKALEPACTLSIGKARLTADDYELSWTENVDAGTGKVHIVGKKNLTGERDVEFTISPAKVGKTRVEGLSAPQTFTGETINPDVTVYLGDTPVDPSDYEVSPDENVHAGKGRLTVTGKRNLEGTRTETFDIVPARMDAEGVSVSIPEGAPIAYTGLPQTPTPKVSINSHDVASDMWEVTYSNNVDAGEATANVKGKGDLTGTKSVTFTISPANASDITIEAPGSITAEDLAQGLPLKAKIGNVTLSPDTDYELTVEHADGSPTGTWKVAGKGKNLTGEATGTFNVVSMKDAITLAPPLAPGRAIELAVGVRFDLMATHPGDGKLEVASENDGCVRAELDGDGKTVHLTAEGAGKTKVIVSSKDTETWAGASVEIPVEVKDQGKDPDDGPKAAYTVVVPDEWPLSKLQAGEEPPVKVLKDGVEYDFEDSGHAHAKALALDKEKMEIRYMVSFTDDEGEEHVFEGAIPIKDDTQDKPAGEPVVTVPKMWPLSLASAGTHPSVRVIIDGKTMRADVDYVVTFEEDLGTGNGTWKLVGKTFELEASGDYEIVDDKDLFRMVAPKVLDGVEVEPTYSEAIVISADDRRPIEVASADESIATVRYESEPELEYDRVVITGVAPGETTISMHLDATTDAPEANLTVPVLVTKPVTEDKPDPAPNQGDDGGKDDTKPDNGSDTGSDDGNENKNPSDDNGSGNPDDKTTNQGSSGGNGNGNQSQTSQQGQGSQTNGQSQQSQTNQSSQSQGTTTSATSSSVMQKMADTGTVAVSAIAAATGVAAVAALAVRAWRRRDG